MIRVIRSARIKAGKGEEARKWAKDVANYLNEKHPGHVWEACTEVFGAFGTLHWTATYASLAEWEADTGKWNASPAWVDLVAKAADLTVEGSWHDVVMRSI